MTESSYFKDSQKLFIKTNVQPHFTGAVIFLKDFKMKIIQRGNKAFVYVAPSYRKLCLKSRKMSSAILSGQISYCLYYIL
nr:MAG TPA: hypothetical protein [Caudoviricetes sp.]